MALVIMSSVSWAVRNRILTSGCRAVMTSAARMPGVDGLHFDVH